MFNIFSLYSITNLFKDYKKIAQESPYLETPYSNEKEDCKKFIQLINNKKNLKNMKFPFYGSILQIIFQKIK